MSRREDIDNAIWEDPDFEQFSPETKLLYIWSFTNRRCGMAGIYKVSTRAMALDTKLGPEQITDALRELADARFAFYAEDKGVLWVRTRVKHLRTTSTSMATSIVRDLKAIGTRHPLSRAFLAEYAGDDWLGEHLREFLDQDPPITETEGSGRTPRVPPEGVQGPGQGTGLGEGVGQGSENHNPEGSSGFVAPARVDVGGEKKVGGADEFGEWLRDYHEVTGRTEVVGSQSARGRFRARRREGFELEQLKLATRGAHGNTWVREHGYDVPETILDGAKIQRYIRLASAPTRAGGVATRSAEIERAYGGGHAEPIEGDAKEVAA